ncbi:ATP-binding protein [uncultured Chryseobacterium sp.]|uniref:sensor histidine kinase n=1 Tax=uncultured Chryseobacterium sp. TaxID=259322 RepID=UPI0025D725EE|nr:ATP-binding protein [uncultured Chryseobacterium sp.]
MIVNFRGTLLKKFSDIDNGQIKNRFIFGTDNFAELPDGTVFIHGLIFNPKNYTATYFKKGFINFDAFADVSKDRFWVLQIPENTSSDLLFSLLDRNKKILKEIRVPMKKLGNFKNFQVFENNFPMISSTEGLFWLDTEKGSAEKISPLKKASPFYINKISRNRIIITYLNSDAVLEQINSNGTLTFLQNVLPGIQSFYFQEGIKNGEIWAGTNEGVFLLDRNFNILKKFDSNNGLAGTNIYGLIADNSGNVWISHQHGLSSIDTKNYNIINFDKEDGIQHWDFNNRGFYKTSDGTLFFGSVNGFNFFRPPLRPDQHYRPEIYFDEIKINNTEFRTGKGINLLSRLDLKHDQNNISVKALIKDLENCNRLRLMYRFRNLDTKWKPVPHKNPLVLSSLSPGTYDLEFGIYDKFSKKTIPQKRLSVNIEKAYYQIFWFWAFLGGLIIGAIVFIFTRWKLMQQKNYYRQQLALEEQRNKITADLHDDIGATLSSLQINSAVAALYLEKRSLPETLDILLKIQQQSQKLSENMGDIVWSLKTSPESLMTLSTRIRNVASEILGKTSINYEIKIDPGIDLEISDFGIRKNIILIVKEALNNALKYSSATRVCIAFEAGDKKYVLQIRDNGTGFSPEEKRGNGLENMKKRAEEMNGSFRIIRNKGICIEISIPRSGD